MKRLLGNIALLLGISLIVAPVAMTQTQNPYVLTAAKIATALGYTPANGSAYCALIGCTMAGDLKFTDATYDIGKSGATRPRDIFVSRKIVSAGTGAIGTTNVASSPFSVTGASGAYSGALSGSAISRVTTGTGANTDNQIAFGVLDSTYGWIQAVIPGSASIPLYINPNGGIVDIGSGGISSTGIPGVSCSAASVALLTLVVTNGIVTHC